MKKASKKELADLKKAAIKFAQDLAARQRPIEPEIHKVINEKLWDWI